MATLSEAVVAILKANASVTAVIGTGSAARIHPQIAPQNAQKPFVTYYIVSEDSSPVHSLQNKAANLAWSRISVECWDENYLAALGLDKKIAAALDGYAGVSAGVTVLSAKRIAGRDLFEPEALPKPLHRIGSDFMINYKL